MSDDGDCCYPVTGYPTPAMTDHAQRAREIVSHFKISIKNAEGGMILEFNQDGMTSLVEDALAQAHAAGRREGLEEAATLIELYKVTEGESLGDAMNEYLDSQEADIRAKAKEGV